MTQTALYDLQAGRSPQLLGDDAQQTITGSLSLTDHQLASNEALDEYRIYARKGQLLRVVMETMAFDPYVIVISPSGEQLENDEHENRQITAAVEWELSEEGEYRIVATSSRVGQYGRYTLNIELIDP